ncbi:MAG: AraC family transcriptional regulator [Firmicutes bacterium]|nr:AraC family transcriptional regulator [Bacillota bacterium]
MMLYKKLYGQKTFIKQFTAYFTLSIITISIIGLMIYYTAVRIIEEEAEKFHLTLINSIKNSIDNRFEEFNKLNMQLSGNRLFNKVIHMREGIDYSRISMIDFLTMFEELASFKSVNSFIDEIFVYLDNESLILTPTGKEEAEYFFNNIFEIENKDMLNLDVLQKNDKDSQIISNLKVTYLGRRYDSMAYIQGIASSYKYNKCYAASLIILTKTNSIIELLNSFNSKGDFNIYILNKKNEIVVSHGNLPYFKGNSNCYLYTGSTNVFRDKIEGLDYIIYHIPSDINELEYVAVVPLSLITQKAGYFKEIFTAVFISAIVFALIMVLLVTRKSLDPLRKIIFTILKDDDYSYSKHECRSEFEVIENCIKKLRNEKNLMQLEMQKYNYIQKNNLIINLLKGNVEYNTDQKDIFLKYGISLPYSYYKVSIFEIEYYKKENYNKANNEKDYCVMPEIILIIKEMLESVLITLKCTSYVVEMERYRIAVLMNINNSSALLDSDFVVKQPNINQILRKIKEEIEDKYDIVITVGIGNTYNIFKGINQSYEEAQKALNFKLIKGKSSVIAYNEICNRETNLHYYYPLDKELALIEGLKSAAFDKIEEILDSIIEENLKKQNPDLAIARFLFYDLQATALKALQELNLSNLDNSIVSQDLLLLNTFGEMMDYIKKMYRGICEEIKSKNESFAQSLIKDILDEIDKKCFDSNFSLNLCASKFGLSNSYLSRFFRENTGLYFSEYLNKKRIEKAKQLLAVENLTIKDIALEVGFINDVTFRRVFKKYELKTPVQYRENNCLKTRLQA